VTSRPTLRSRSKFWHRDQCDLETLTSLAAGYQQRRTIVAGDQLGRRDEHEVHDHGARRTRLFPHTTAPVSTSTHVQRRPRTTALSATLNCRRPVSGENWRHSTSAELIYVIRLARDGLRLAYKSARTSDFRTELNCSNSLLVGRCMHHVSPLAHNPLRQVQSYVIRLSMLL